MPGVVLGVDGCRRGWVGARVARNELTWVTLPHARAAVASDADAIGVDIPIGLPESGPRACDRAARRLLSRRGVCVFPAPARAVLTAVLTARLTAGSYEQACAASRAAIGTALPRQSWNLVPKIIEWDALVDPELQRRVVEVHPEVTYAVSTGRPAPAKRSQAGVAARIAALAAWLPGLAATLAARPPGVAVDDALDAALAAWSAARWLSGQARVLPAGVPPRDRRGRFMEIVA